MGKCNPFAISLLRHTSQSLQNGIKNVKRKYNSIDNTFRIRKKWGKTLEQHAFRIWNSSYLYVLASFSLVLFHFIRLSFVRFCNVTKEIAEIIEIISLRQREYIYRGDEMPFNQTHICNPPNTRCLITCKRTRARTTYTMMIMMSKRNIVSLNHSMGAEK